MRDYEMFDELRKELSRARGDFVLRSPDYNDEEKARWDRIEELVSRMYKRLVTERDLGREHEQDGC